VCPLDGVTLLDARLANFELAPGCAILLKVVTLRSVVVVPSAANKPATTATQKRRVHRSRKCPAVQLVQQFPDRHGGDECAASSASRDISKLMGE
jgi:hypothetical protein